MNFIFHTKRLYSAVNLTNLQYTYAEKDWIYDKHRHPYYEFLHCISGKIEQAVGDDTYLLGPGDSLIIQGGFFHKTRIIESSEFLGFHFDVENTEINRAIHHSNNIFITAKTEPTLQQYIMNWVTNFIHQYREILNLTSPSIKVEDFTFANSELEIHGHVILLICQIAKYAYENKEKEMKHNSFEVYIAEEIAKIIHTRSISDFKIADISSEIHLHRTYITSIFSKIYGMSPKQYHLNVKLEKAKELLLETHLSIEEIAERLNFYSSSHFSRFFTKQAGIAPSKYRNRHFSV
ncbi:helix-turn-helix transcriptional regulator [Bacillus sp. SD088]|uniref:helix-turn-helix transcriptional regulator n=1 Tax=Bacillus sp. SD088 TaxID=2782012 RepID=UPI001A968B03|nr:AraC family transcriptional regulator [Bacillus sp. SD088]MBO0991498.1 helix-turn-helix domain-containing protein [Bacillus sp. SD088]